MNRNQQFLLFALALYIIYSLQGILYGSGTMVTQALLFVFLLIGFVGFFRTTFLQSSNPKFVLALSVFFLLLTVTFLIGPKTVYGVTFEGMGMASTFGQYKSICFVILSFFLVYYYTKKRPMSEKTILILGIVLIGVAVMRYFYSIQMLQIERGRDEMQNNAAYNIIAVIPFMPFLFRKYKILTTVLSVFLISLIINAAKRGAIVCLIVSVFLGLLYYMRHSRLSSFKQFWILVVMIAVSFLMIQLTMQNDFLMDRLDDTREGNLGSREIAYAMLWDSWLRSDNVFTMFFGRGLMQTVNVWGNTAHNDWLELLIDNGLLGVIVYIYFFVTVFRYITKMDEGGMFQLGAFLSIAIFLTKTFFSMGYADFINVPLLISLGIYTGNYEYSKRVTQIIK